jgi:hypothetical protein
MMSQVCVMLYSTLIRLAFLVDVDQVRGLAPGNCDIKGLRNLDCNYPIAQHFATV